VFNYVDDWLDKFSELFHNFKNSLKKIKPETWLIFIIILALAIRLNFFLGMNLNDDEIYYDSTYNIIQGKFVLNE